MELCGVVVPQLHLHLLSTSLISVLSFRELIAVCFTLVEYLM